MADDTTAAEDSPITFHIKASNDAKFTLTLPAATTVSDLKNKLSTSEYADTPAERQRLIYSGRVLKDNDTLEFYKLKDGHTIHLVKSAASNQRQAAGAAQNAASATPPGSAANPAASAVPTNLAAGTGNNPLAGLTGARYAGFAQLPGADMFGPDGGMGGGDPDYMLRMLENPQFQSQMNEALQNPQVIDMMIQQNPMLREMGPHVRQIFQNPEFRRMMTDPDNIRQSMQMHRAAMGGGADTAFPAPGVTNTTPEENRNAQGNGNSNNNATPPNPGMPPFNPFMMNPNMGNMGAGNPFAALFGGNPGQGGNGTPTPSDGAAGSGAQQGAGDGATGEGQNQQNAQNPFSLFNPAMFGGGAGGPGGANIFDPQQNPLLRDPQALQRAAQMLQALGGGGQGGAGADNPFASMFGGGGFGNTSPPDNRPPEERYEQQLRQLNDMGFFEFERNIEALRRAGGSVQGAVEYLLNPPS